jgi:hypothetical protein
MSEKVRLPKEVCDALDFLRITKNNSCSEIVYRLYGKNVHLPDVLLNQNSETIMQALVIGYEPELTAEEQIKELYKYQRNYTTDLE